MRERRSTEAENGNAQRTTFVSRDGFVSRVDVAMSHAPAFAAATLFLLLPGCALFMGNGDTSGNLPSPGGWFGESEATDDGPTLNTARLEASIVTRPAHDQRIREHVWLELDESGLMAPDRRQKLNRNGFRMAVASGNAPWALQSLVREAQVAVRSTEGQPSMASHTLDKFTGLGPTFSVMQNGKSLIEIQSQLDPQVLQLQDLPELASLRDTSGLRCVMEVSVKELTDDMALLSVLPQIHAGANTTRFNISGSTPQLPVRQNIVPLYDQQFTVRLHTGDIVVIGQQRSESWNTGRLFFEPLSGSAATERLLIIRLAGVDQMKGHRDSSFRLGAYDK
ncbi:MAG TPA: hypothetical protein PLY87_22260 [Planctomycetaceae bacterium]|nr:hypothetical protein [Planctomycetaceae bacterium]